MLEPPQGRGKSGSTSHWRAVFKKRAATKHGTNPTAQQVAEEFIAYGVERKNTIRQAFKKFFADVKVDSADIISKVA